MAIRSTLAWVVWIGVAAIFLHVGLSAKTSRDMLANKEFPPSQRKKNHLALKWLTGALILLVAVVHVFAPVGWVGRTVVSALLAIALAVHLCTCARSLLKDLRLDAGYKTPFRVVVIVVTVVICLLMALG